MEGKANYAVITVSNTLDKDRILKQIYNQLTAEPSITLTIQQENNKIKVFHNVSNGVKILVKTYVVIIIPITVDLTPLNSFYGNIDFYLDDTINHLTTIITKLQSLKGHKVIKGSNNGKSLEQQLAGLLY